MKKYLIYTLKEQNLLTEVKEFFIEDSEESVNSKWRRYSILKDYMKNGWLVTCVQNVDEPTYLNERVNVRVTAYCDLDRKEQEILLLDLHNEVNRDTLTMVQELKQTALTQIKMGVRRIINEDFDVDNEIALMLYDMKLPMVI